MADIAMMQLNILGGPKRVAGGPAPTRVHFRLSERSCFGRKSPFESICRRSRFRPGRPVPAESDRRPLHLCPVCLRKLRWSIGFDVLERYRALERVTRADGFGDEADWLSHEIRILSAE